VFWNIRRLSRKSKFENILEQSTPAYYTGRSDAQQQLQSVYEGAPGRAMYYSITLCNTKFRFTHRN